MTKEAPMTKNQWSGDDRFVIWISSFLRNLTAAKQFPREALAQ
jgi:hypothetical protein